MNIQREQNELSNPRANSSPVTLERFAEAIAKFVAERAAVDASRIDADFDFMKARLLDSISTIELFSFIQDQFDKDYLRGEITIAELNTPAKLYRRYLDVRWKHDGSK